MKKPKKPQTKTKTKAKTSSFKLERFSAKPKNLLLFAVIFAGIGSALLILTHAATPTASIEPETKTVTSPAITGNDSSASGGKYVQFKAASGGDDTSGTFHTSGGTIISPSGSNFYPVGANVGTFDNFNITGDALGQSASAQDWGWNIIRLTLYMDDPFGAPVGNAKTKAQQIVNEYTAKHIVVMVGDWSCFSKGSPTTPALCANELAWISDFASTNKANPYVWINCYNEPHVTDSGWVTLQKACIDTVRGAGNTAPIVADAQGAGQDSPNTGSGQTTYIYTPSMGPAVLAYDPLHNVLFSQHNYSSYCTSAAEGAYMDSMHAAGLTMIMGEYGFTEDGSYGAGGYAQNYACTQTNIALGPSKNVGLIVWHGTMQQNDHFALRSSGQPFYGTSALTDLGSRVWALTH